MLYGQDKAREIARSVLPSTRRRSARQDAARLKRSTRRLARRSLRDWASHTDPYEYEGHIYDYDEPSPCHAYWGTIKNVMWERRNGDKLGALLRWAPAVTAHLDDPEDRYMAMKAVLPDNLIGRHALSHLEFMDEFDRGDTSRRARFAWPARVPDPWRDPTHIEHVVREILAAGWHKDLNRRLLVKFAGLHELDEFIERVNRYDSPDKRALIATWEAMNGRSG